MQLVIAEKPSVAQSIAKVLGAGKRADGYMEGGGYRVSWCVGHLVETAMPDAYDERYKKWVLSDLPFIPADKWLTTVSLSTKKQYDCLAKLLEMSDTDSVVCATDAGREGELIFRLLYDNCGCKKPILRLWISSMEESAIKKGFEELRPGGDFERLYEAALCRERADYLVGINATRLFSIAYNCKLNVGRVMTPTLALLAAREAKIKSFTQEKFYSVEVDCGKFTAFGKRISDKQQAEAVRAACEGQTATVANVEAAEKSVSPPKLYDLTTLQREANRMLGYSAQQTLDCVQALYEKKLSTYPRTDSQYLTDDMRGTVPNIVACIRGVMPFATEDTAINIDPIINNAKVSDHHAIIPTKEIARADFSSLPTAEANILMLIAVKLLCAVGDAHRYAETDVTVEVGEHIFRVCGKTVTAEGWKKIEADFRASLRGKDAAEKSGADLESKLPPLTVGQKLEVSAALCREGVTSPPKPYTEDTLLSAMETAGVEDMPDDAERKGIGTPATRASTIEKLLKGGFVLRDDEKKGKTKHLRPTEKGGDLIGILPEIIKSPLLTAQWETKLKEIEHGKLSAAAFMAEISEFLHDLVKNYGKPTAAVPQSFISENTRESLGECPRCKSPVYEGKTNFYCSNRECTFAFWKNDKFWEKKKKTLTKAMVSTLLKNGRIRVTGLHSEEKNKLYDAVVILDDTGKYVNYKMEFEKKK